MKRMGSGGARSGAPRVEPAGQQFLADELGLVGGAQSRVALLHRGQEGV